MANDDDDQNCIRIVVVIFLIITIFIITIPFIFVIFERWEVSNNSHYKRLVLSYKTIPLEEAVLESIYITEQEGFTFRPYACLFKDNGSFIPYYSKYINYEGYKYITEKNQSRFEKDHIWKLRLVAYEIQLVFMRILNSLEPPISHFTKQLLNIDNYTDDFDKTVNCFNPLTMINKETFIDISKLSSTWLRHSPIYNDQIHHMNATIEMAVNFFQDKISENERDTHTFINLVGLSIATLLIVGTIISTQYCYYHQIRKQIRSITQTEITPLLSNTRTHY